MGLGPAKKVFRGFSKIRGRKAGLRPGDRRRSQRRPKAGEIRRIAGNGGNRPPAAENRPQSPGESLRSQEGEILPQKPERAAQRPQRKNSGICRPVAEHHGQPAPTAAPCRRSGPPPRPPPGSPEQPQRPRRGTSPERRPRASPRLLGRNSATSAALPAGSQQQRERPQRPERRHRPMPGENSSPRPRRGRPEYRRRIPACGAGKAPRAAPAQGDGPLPTDHRVQRPAHTGSGDAAQHAAGSGTTDRRKIAIRTAERPAEASKGKSCPWGREGHQRGSSTRIWARPARL